MKKILLIVLIIAVLGGVGFYFLHKNQNLQNQTATQNNTVTIMVPSNLQGYQDAMIRYASDGGNNPINNFQFVPKSVSLDTITIDPAIATYPLANVAEAAAEVISTQAGTQNLVAYFKVINGTAYILLNMDIDGWAGVSFAIAQVHPIIEKSLLAQPGITTVKFELAPGDHMGDTL